MNTEFEMEPSGPKFADPEAQKFYDIVGEECPEIWEYEKEEELRAFFQEKKRFFVYDGGSNDDDYPSYNGWCDTEEDVDEFLNEEDVYNYEHVFVYDTELGKQMEVQRKYTLTEYDAVEKAIERLKNAGIDATRSKLDSNSILGGRKIQVGSIDVYEDAFWIEPHGNKCKVKVTGPGNLSKEIDVANALKAAHWVIEDHWMNQREVQNRSNG